jgi:hypothetical protein
VKLLTKEGNPLVEIDSLEADEAGLIVKARMMGTIRTTLYLDPENLWEGMRLLCKRKVAFYLFRFLVFRLFNRRGH